VRDNQEAIADTRRQLEVLLGRGIPRAHSRWSFDVAVQFKAAHLEAHKAVHNRRATLLRLRNALAELRGFHEL
jgi:hypothetical protein